jgi:hypothetical protein
MAMSMLARVCAKGGREGLGGGRGGDRSSIDTANVNVTRMAREVVVAAEDDFKIGSNARRITRANTMVRDAGDVL